MRAGPARAGARRIATGLSVLALAACHQGAADQDGNVVIANAQAAAPDSPANIVVTDRIERLDSAAPPAPVATPTGEMQVHRNFTDPPLPAELNDDGGLKPLPPRPHPGG